MQALRAFKFVRKGAGLMRIRWTTRQRLCITMATHVLVFLACIHWVACLWYATSLFDDDMGDNTGKQSWSARFADFEQMDVTERYRLCNTRNAACHRPHACTIRSLCIAATGCPLTSPC